MNDWLDHSLDRNRPRRWGAGEVDHAGRLAGAFVGGFLASLIGLGEGGLIWTIIVATIGAFILLAIYRALVGGRRSTSRR
jgi:outer membrane lipoprotein SlyB